MSMSIALLVMTRLKDGGVVTIHQGGLPILRAQWFHCHTTLQTSTDLLGASFFGLSEVDFKNRRGGIGLGFYFQCIVSQRFIMSLGKILCALQVF